MLNLKDVEVGTWVYDTTGVYEVTDIDGRAGTPYTLNEVIDDEVTDTVRLLTESEVRRMDIL